MALEGGQFPIITRGPARVYIRAADGSGPWEEITAPPPDRCESVNTRYARRCREFRGLRPAETIFGRQWLCARHRRTDAT